MIDYKQKYEQLSYEISIIIKGRTIISAIEIQQTLNKVKNQE